MAWATAKLLPNNNQYEWNKTDYGAAIEQQLRVARASVWCVETGTVKEKADFEKMQGTIATIAMVVLVAGSPFFYIIHSIYSLTWKEVRDNDGNNIDGWFGRVVQHVKDAAKDLVTAASGAIAFFVFALPYAGATIFGIVFYNRALTVWNSSVEGLDWAKLEETVTKAAADQQADKAVAAYKAQNQNVAQERDAALLAQQEAETQRDKALQDVQLKHTQLEAAQRAQQEAEGQRNAAKLEVEQKQEALDNALLAKQEAETQRDKAQQELAAATGVKDESEKEGGDANASPVNESCGSGKLDEEEGDPNAGYLRQIDEANTEGAIKDLLDRFTMQPGCCDGEFVKPEIVTHALLRIVTFRKAPSAGSNIPNIKRNWVKKYKGFYNDKQIPENVLSAFDAKNQIKTKQIS